MEETLFTDIDFSCCIFKVNQISIEEESCYNS